MVGQEAGQRRAQLVRGVGDELTLAGEHALGLDERGLQAAEHLVQGARQLADLVVGARHRHAASRVPRPGDLAGCRRQRGDRPHRLAGQQEAGEERQACASQHAEDEEEADALDRAPRRSRPCARTG